MKKIIIHVGMGKTGTTYLQKRVFPHVDGVFFANRWKEDPIGDFLRRIKVVNPVLIEKKKEKERIDSFVETLKERVLLISDEGLFGSAFENFVNHRYTAEVLKYIFPDAMIFLVVRRQDAWCESSYNFTVQIGYPIRKTRFFNYRKGSFGDFVSSFMGPNIDVKQLDLYRYAGTYIDLFGKENVLILPYELFQKDNKAFLRKLYEFYGIKPFYPERVKRENEAFSAVSIHMAVLLNRFLAKPFNSFGFVVERPFFRALERRYPRNIVYKTLTRISARMTLRYVLRNTVDKILKRRYRSIDNTMRRQIMGFHAESNRKLSEAIGIDLSEYGYY